jgi:arsenate reductase
VNVQSAGSNPAGYIHPLAIKVMAETGVDISGQRSKHMNEFLTQPIHTVITVCGNADQACPVFPGQVKRRHWPFDDPAKATGTEDEVLTCFRRVRDEMRCVFEAYAADCWMPPELREADPPVIGVQFAATFLLNRNRNRNLNQDAWEERIRIKIKIKNQAIRHISRNNPVTILLRGLH